VLLVSFCVQQVEETSEFHSKEKVCVEQALGSCKEVPARGTARRCMTKRKMKTAARLLN